MSAKTVHVAAENAEYRAALKDMLVAFGVGGIIVTSREGAEGVIAVRNSNPEMLVVAVGRDEDATEHLLWYREAAPQAYIIGVAFNEDESHALIQAGADKVVAHDISRDKMLVVCREAERQA